MHVFTQSDLYSLQEETLEETEAGIHFEHQLNQQRRQNCNATTEFACHTPPHCILKVKHCDGNVDCPDGSDEALCSELLLGTAIKR